MKKRKNIILSAITCFVSICLMMFGVYAATNPSVNLSGQVSYTARDAKVLVQGKVNGSKNQTVVDYPSATVTTNDVTATKVTNKSTQYLDYTAGTGNSASDNLSPWSIGTLEFVEDNNGINNIVINFKLTNLSTYSVQASVTFAKTDSELASANVTRSASETNIYFAQNGGSKELTITYSVKDDSKSVVASDLLNMNITFEKTLPPIPVNSVSKINEDGGNVTIGKMSSSSTAEDVEWRCFAYSTDGTTWTKLASGATIPDDAKYGYFVLETYFSNLSGKVFLPRSKYNTSTYMHTDVSNVKANDYYYSDIRKTLTNLESTLHIDKNSEMYKAILPRTMTDLYIKNTYNGSSYSNQTAPTNAVMTTKDTFWLMSHYEVSTYFDSASRIFDNKAYWLRSSTTASNYSIACLITADGTFNNNCSVDWDYCVRPAFKMQFEKSSSATEPAKPTGYTVSFTEGYDSSSDLDGVTLSFKYTYEDNTTKTKSYSKGGTFASEYNVIGVQIEPADSHYIYYTMNGKRDVLYNLGTGNPSAYLELTGDLNFEIDWWYKQDCILANSLVTMADGTFKQLGDIKTGDYILSYDWETKKLVPNKVIYASSEDTETIWTTIRYFRRTFSDGTIIDNAFAHRFYNIEKGCFAYLEEWEIGDHIYKGDGTTPYLVSVETIYEDCTFGRITGENGTNYFANGFLTGDRHCPSGLTIDDLKDSLNYNLIPTQNA